MVKKLVRGKNAPSDSEVLSDSEFIKVALLNIAAKATALAEVEVSNPTNMVDTFSDILDLTCAVLIKENINPADLYKNAAEKNVELGSFMDKKVEKE